MKKLIFILGLLASVSLFAMSNDDKLSADQINTNMESFRDYKWGDSERDYNAFIYSVYYTGTRDAAEAAKIEAKVVQELKEGKGNARYKMLLAQVLEITGVRKSSAALVEIINKNSANPENRGWIERLFSGIVTGGDKNAKNALVTLSKSNSDYVRLCAVTSLGGIKQGDAEVAQILSAQIKGGFKDMPLTYACIAALSKIGSENAVKFLYDTSKKAKSPELKQYCLGAFFGGASSCNADFSSAYNEILADKNASVSAKIEAFTALLRCGKTPKIGGEVFSVAAIDMLRSDKSIKIPAGMELSKLPEPLQVLMVQALTARGEGYADIIKLNPKTPQLAEAICAAAAKMGTDKDYPKLLSFAPLFDKRGLSKIGYYIASVPGTGRVLKLNACVKGASPEVADLAMATVEHIDSSSEADALLEIAKSGQKDAQIFAIKALGTALAKNEDVFVKVSAMYPSFADAQVSSAAQRLLVNNSRVGTTQKMFASAAEQYKLAKEPRQKTFFLRFTSPYGGKDAAEFLGSVYSAGMKSEALAEFGKWQSEDAFATLQKLEKSDAANKAAIRDIMVEIVQKNNLRESPIIKYISDTATNSKEKNLVNLMDLPNFAVVEEKNLGGGLKGKSTHRNNDFKLAFDGNINTRWDTGTSRTKGMGVMFNLANVENVKGVELLLGSSRGDRVQEPVVYAGESADNLSKVKIKYERADDKDILVFEKPMKAKTICIVNTKDQGGFWSIHEVNILK